MKTNWLKYILMCVASIGLLASCDNDEDGYSYGDFLYNMVTYMGNEDGEAVFTYQAYNDSPLITLMASNYNPSTVKVGQRLLLNYEIETDLGQYRQVVKVKGTSTVYTDTIRMYVPNPTEQMKMDPLKVESVWRSGNYLNVRCKVQYTEEPRKMYLFTTGEVDENGVISCYQIQDLMGAKTYYWTETYMSYYIEPIMNLDGFETLRYYVNDEKKAYDLSVLNYHKN